jgi:hypothetical protein
MSVNVKTEYYNWSRHPIYTRPNGTLFRLTPSGGKNNTSNIMFAYKLASRNRRNINPNTIPYLSNSKGRYVMSNGFKAKPLKNATNTNKNNSWNNSTNKNNNNNNVIKNNTVMNVNLPNNGATDPISLHNFTKGNNAIMITQTTKGTNKKHKFYYQQNILEQLAKNKWSTILHMTPKTYLFKNPVTKLKVYRGDLKKVKFIKNKNS